MADLEELQRCLEALDPTLKDRVSHARQLRDLAFDNGIHLRTDQAMGSLDNDIQLKEESLDETPVHQQDRALRLYELAAAYLARFEAKENQKDHVQQLQHLARSHDIPFQDGKLLELEEFSQFALGLDERPYADLYESLDLYDEAVGLTPLGHPERATRLASLAFAWKIKSTDLDQSIELYQEALDITPDSDKNYADRLHDLAHTYEVRSQAAHAISGEDDLDQCISLYKGAFDKTPHDHPDQLPRFISVMLAHKLKSKQSLEDTDGAIQVYKEGLKIVRQAENSEEGKIYEADILELLGEAYDTRFEKTDDMADSDQALQYFQQALDTRPATDFYRAERLEQIGSQYNDRFKITDNLQDLDRAIDSYLKAIVIETSRVDPDKLVRTLADAYHSRFLRTNCVADLDKAIELYQEAIGLIPEDTVRIWIESRRGILQWELASAYKDRWEAQKSPKDLEDFLAFGQKALEHPSAFATVRIEYGVEILRLCASLEMWPQAYRAASAAVSLIPLLSSRFEDNTQRQSILASSAGLASDAAAIAILAGEDTYEAIRLVDLGRGIIVGSMSDERSDISELQKEHPQLAEDLVRSRDELDSSHDLGTQLVWAGQNLERTIKEIRAHPGFERFLMIPSEDELKAAAAKGPIVIINVSRYRCDALIIHENGLVTRALPQLLDSEIQARATGLAHLESLDLNLLEWLWDTITGPILDSLGFTDALQSEWPRVWWIPTGLLTKFPIHAAGYHYRDSDSVLDRVTSSYISSVRALLQTRHKHAVVTKNGTNGAVLVGMATTPGQASLPYVPFEVERLKRLFASIPLNVKADCRSRKEVLSAMRTASIFHFAGHGRTDRLDPLDSALLLGDGPMTIESLFKQNLHSHKPLLAYLSACGTGQIKQDELMDEGIHLIAAYQIAGFRHVIGTLWAVNDEFCMEAAVATYEWMKSQELTDESVSEGLHRATLKLRELWAQGSGIKTLRQGLTSQGKTDGKSQTGIGQRASTRDVDSFEDAPLYWVPYVHFGM